MMMSYDQTQQNLQPTLCDEGELAQVAGSEADSVEEFRRLRLVFENMLEGYAYCRMLYDADGQPVDFIYEEVNPAFDLLTGLSDVVGKRVTEVIPGIKESNPELFEIYGRVARTGVSERLEVKVEQLEIELCITVFRPEPGHFVAVFQDISARKRAERELEEANRYLEWRVEQRTRDLAEALRIARLTHRDK